MKKIVSMILLCLTVSAVCIGCGKQTVEKAPTSQKTAIGNPWKDWDSMEEAETAVGFSFALPEVIADRYTATVFRTLNNELMEVLYRDADFEICVRKQKGEGQDISGDYNQYDTCTEEKIQGGTIIRYGNANNNAAKQIISYKGFSWSIVATDSCSQASNWDFFGEILE